MPMRGIGEPQAHKGNEGFLGSGREPFQIESPPIDSGNRHDQHTSVIGLMNLPWQVTVSARAGAAAAKASARRRVP
jgi:hypothetical protein